MNTRGVFGPKVGNETTFWLIHMIKWGQRQQVPLSGVRALAVRRLGRVKAVGAEQALKALWAQPLPGWEVDPQAGFGDGLEPV